MNGLLRMRTLEDVAATDQHINTSLHQPWSCFALNTTIHLYQCLRPAVADETAQSLHLQDGVLYELLAAKTWVYTHQQHHVDIGNDVFKN